MTAPESVLTSRNATLSDIVALLRRQHDARLDVVVPARDLHMTAGDLSIEGIGEPTITLEGVTPTRGVFRPTSVCDGGIAEKLGIPLQYLRRMRDEQLTLLDHNVNTCRSPEVALRPTAAGGLSQPILRAARCGQSAGLRRVRDQQQ